MIGSIIWTILYGIIEGITEWLPVSSTGHLIIFENLWNINNDIFTTAFLEFFRVAIQFGAILAVFVAYIKRLNPFSRKLTQKGRKRVWNNWIKIIIGCIPAGIVGLLFDDWVDSVFYNWQTVAFTLTAYGIGFIVVESLHKNDVKYSTMEQMPNSIALLVGCAQVLALIPGTSRSGVTIIAGLLLGCSRVAVMDFTFCMAIPIMAGASGLKLLKYFVDGNILSMDQILILVIGLIVAYLVSMAAVEFITKFVRSHTFKGFGYYRIALSVLIVILGVFTSIFGNKSIYGLPSYVDEQYIEVNEFSRPGVNVSDVKDIVIHYTANPGSTAQNNRDYFNNLSQQTSGDTNATYASSNFVVGIDGEIIAVVPIDEIAYCSNSRNSDSLSIEVCHEDTTGKFTEKTYESTVKLTAWLCNHFGLTSEHVIRHFDVSGKLCPLYFVENEDEWNQFKNDVQTEINSLVSETAKED